jgi:acetyl esterase/lipase
VAGDSAGGGLALALLLLLRDRGDPLPAGAALISPWTDLLGTGLAIAGRARIDPLLRWDDLKARAAEYAGRHGLADPLISPLYGDFRGLPPLLILVGTREILYDDSTRLALRACQAGVPVTLVVGGGMPHVWPAYARFIPEGRQAIGRIGLFIRQTQMHGSGRHLLADEGDLRLPDLVVGDEVDLPG